MPKEQLRAMVVEDEPFVSILEASILKENGFEVVTAGSAKEARKKLNGKPFNLFIVDKNLEDFSYGGSMELVELIQKTCPTSYLAMVTGEAGPGNARGIIFLNKLWIENTLPMLAQKVKEKPFRERAIKARNLRKSLERPLVVKDARGRLHIFKFVEGDPEPPGALGLLLQGGHVLTLEQALADPLCKGSIEKTLLEHQAKLNAFIKKSLARKKARKKKATKKPKPRTRRGR